MDGKRLVVSLLLLFLAYSVSADEYPDKVAINVGANYVWDSNTEFSARASSGVLGTSIDFERDLNGEEQVTSPWINGYYRFTPHHRIDFGWINIDRKGHNSLDRELTFGDSTYAVDSLVSSEVDASFGKLAYTWSFHHSDEVELGLTAGAALIDYSLKLESPLNRREENVSTPAPTIGFRVDYAINPRWHMKLDTDSLYFDIQDKLRGSFDSNVIAMEWRTTPNVVLGLNVKRLAIDAKVDDGSFRGNVNDFYRSAGLYAGVRF